MKQIVVLIIIMFHLALTVPALAEFSTANTVWEVRTAGTMLNGGGFNSSVTAPGTDYSQQDAAQHSGTDLACADGDAATPLVVSISHNFVEADEGNIIHITAGAGWTAGWYVITDTSGNAAVLDRACGSDGALTSGTWYEGGAIGFDSTTYNAEWFNGSSIGGLIAGNTVYILNGTYAAIDEPITGTAGGAATPITVIGYNGTRAAGASGTNRPILDFEANAIAVTTGYWVLKNLIITGTATTVASVGMSTYIENCKITNTSGSANRIALLCGVVSRVFGCELSSTNGYALQLSSGAVIGSYVHDSANGIWLDSQNAVVIGNIVDTCSVNGIKASSSARDNVIIVGNTLFGNNDADAIGIDANGSKHWLILNNLITHWYTGIGNANITTREDYNYFYANSNGLTANTHSIDSATSPYLGDLTAVQGGDFRVGTAAKAQGYPNGVTLPGTSVDGKGYTDMGALQRVEPTPTDVVTRGF